MVLVPVPALKDMCRCLPSNDGGERICVAEVEVEAVAQCERSVGVADSTHRRPSPGHVHAPCAANVLNALLSFHRTSPLAAPFVSPRTLMALCATGP